MPDESPSPYGVPNAAESSPDPSTIPAPELLAAFVRGEQGRAATGWRIEGPVLVGGATSLAIRLSSDAVLVRAELPDELAEQTAQVAEALTEAGLHHIEERTVLGHVIGIEVAGIRGSEWDLWATEAAVGHTALKERALGDIAERIDPEEPARRAREEDSLRQLERDLWP